MFARRNICASTFLACVSAAAPASADELAIVPPRCTVAGIHAKLNRAENSNVSIATNRLGRWMDDGSTGVIENKGSRDYKIRYPKLFAPSRRAYKIKVGGQFSTGSWRHWVQSKDYPAMETHPDNVVVHLYGGEHEDSNTDVTISLGGACLSSVRKVR